MRAREVATGIAVALVIALVLVAAAALPTPGEVWRARASVGK